MQIQCKSTDDANDLDDDGCDADQPGWIIGMNFMTMYNASFKIVQAAQRCRIVRQRIDSLLLQQGDKQMQKDEVSRLRWKRQQLCIEERVSRQVQEVLPEKEKEEQVSS
jgi:hypothetical protein